MADVLRVAARTVVLYVVTLITVRLMGKRSVGNLAPFDLAVIIMIGSAAVIPMEEESVGLVRGAVPVLVLGLAQFLLSLANLYLRPLERVTQGIPVMLVQNGQVQWDNLRRERVTIEDLRIILRSQGVSAVEEVQEARLEPNGVVSIIRKKEASPVTPKDLQELAMARLDAAFKQASAELKADMEKGAASITEGRARPH